MNSDNSTFSTNKIVKTFCSSISQVARVIRITKIRHISRTFVSPSHTLWAFKYHYRRVPERAFIEFLAKQYGCSLHDIDIAYKNFKNNSSLWNELTEKLSVYPNGYGLQMTRE